MIEFKRILSPVDFSDSSNRALAHAAALARWYGAQLTVLHVVPTFEPMQIQAELGVPVQIVNPMTREEVMGGCAVSRARRCFVGRTPGRRGRRCISGNRRSGADDWR